MSRINRRDFMKYVSSLSVAPILGQDHGARSCESEDKPNVVILLFDTLSARHVSLYGYDRETTPNLSRFARRAVVYHNHYAGGNFTVPGTASLLTGTYPWTHRALNLAGRMVHRFKHKTLFGLVDDTYNRIAYPHNVYVHYLLNQARQNIDVYLQPQTFGMFDDMYHAWLLSGDQDIGLRAMEELLFRNNDLPGALFSALLDEVRTWVSVRSIEREFSREYPRGVPFLSHYGVYFLVEDIMSGVLSTLSRARQPFLAYFHLFPPHRPYCPRAKFAGAFQDNWRPVPKPPHPLSSGCPQEFLDTARAIYDEYIAHVDAEFGRLYDSMQRNGLLRNSLLIITSDHGELFERGLWGHESPLLYEPLIRIPLLIAKPGQEQREDVYALTSCVDLLPSLLSLTGQAVPNWCEGQLLPALGGESDSDRTIFALEARHNASDAPLTRATVALIRGSSKLIHYRGYPGYEDRYELYDLMRDPQEMDDLYESKPSTAADLRHQLTQKLEEVNHPYRSRARRTQGY